MDPLEEFKHELQDALVHLHDPDYWPTEHVCAATGCDPGEGPGAVQSAIIQLIESLEPDPSVPPGSRSRRDFEVLHHRFVLKLTQEETAERMHMSVRSVQRAQREATHTLARLLWERGRARDPSAVDRAQEVEMRVPEATGTATELTSWLSQVRQELASLQRSAPDAEADVGATVLSALRIARALTASHGIGLEAERVQPNLRVMFHPSALRQVLLAAIAELAQHTPSGRITLSTDHEGDRVRITIAACPASADGPVDVSLARELLSAQGGSITSLVDGDRISLVVELSPALPTEDRITVLAVDDNLDLIALYTSYCAGTPYELVHVPEGQRAFQAIEVFMPDIILLDVMLPDVDGWDLLLDLHANPTTKAIPIIVCSVVRDEQLALALGAALYLRKPVWRQQLIAAFDQALSQAATGAR